MGSRAGIFTKKWGGGNWRKVHTGGNHRPTSPSWIVVKMLKWGWWAGMGLGQPWEEKRWEFWLLDDSAKMTNSKNVCIFGWSEIACRIAAFEKLEGEKERTIAWCRSRKLARIPENLITDYLQVLGSIECWPTQWLSWIHKSLPDTILILDLYIREDV